MLIKFINFIRRLNKGNFWAYGSYEKIQIFSSVSLKLCLLGQKNREMGYVYQCSAICFSKAKVVPHLRTVTLLFSGNLLVFIRKHVPHIPTAVMWVDLSACHVSEDDILWGVIPDTVANGNQ